MELTTELLTEYSKYPLTILALWILIRCARSMLQEHYEPEVWGYLEFPDGTSQALNNWECILGTSSASDVMLSDDSVHRSHAAMQRDGKGRWNITSLDKKAAVFVNGAPIDTAAPLRDGDHLRLGDLRLTFWDLSDAQRGTLQRNRTEAGGNTVPHITLLLLVMFQILVCFQLCLHTAAEHLVSVVLSFGLLILMEWVVYFLMRGMGVNGFEPETIAFFLTTVGFSVVVSSVPEDLAKQCMLLLVALALFFALGIWLRDLQRVRILRWPMAFAALGFLALNLLMSETIWGAKNWLSIMGQSLQPSEFVKIAYVYAGAATLDRLYQKRNLWMFIAFSAVCTGALALMGDFGTALVYFICFLVISFMRSGSFTTMFLAVGAAVVGVFMVLTVKPYVAQRFATWGNAWDEPLGSGFQQVRTMTATAAGGLFGRGAGSGWLKNVVAANTDLVFGVVCEELGLAVGVGCVVAILLLAFFAVRSSAGGRSAYYVIASCATVTIFMVQVVLNVFGSLDMLPFTGVTFPFVSKGGSSLLSCWTALAYIKAGDTRQNASFALRMRFERRRGRAGRADG